MLDKLFADLIKLKGVSLERSEIWVGSLEGAFSRADEKGADIILVPEYLPEMPGMINLKVYSFPKKAQLGEIEIKISPEE